MQATDFMKAKAVPDMRTRDIQAENIRRRANNINAEIAAMFIDDADESDANDGAISADSDDDSNGGGDGPNPPSSDNEDKDDEEIGGGKKRKRTHGRVDSDEEDEYASLTVKAKAAKIQPLIRAFLESDAWQKNWNQYPSYDAIAKAIGHGVTDNVIQNYIVRHMPEASQKALVAKRAIIILEYLATNSGLTYEQIAQKIKQEKGYEINRIIVNKVAQKNRHKSSKFGEAEEHDQAIKAFLDSNEWQKNWEDYDYEAVATKIGNGVTRTMVALYISRQQPEAGLEKLREKRNEVILRYVQENKGLSYSRLAEKIAKKTDYKRVSAIIISKVALAAGTSSERCLSRDQLATIDTRIPIIIERNPGITVKQIAAKLTKKLGVEVSVPSVEAAKRRIKKKKTSADHDSDKE